MELGQETALSERMIELSKLDVQAGQVILGTLGTTVNGRAVSIFDEPAEFASYRDLLLTGVAEKMVTTATMIQTDFAVDYPAYMYDVDALKAELILKYPVTP